MQNICNWVLCLCLVALFFITLLINYPSTPDSESLKSSFDNYIEKYNKSYKDIPEEYAARFHNFKASLDEIAKLNAEINFYPEDTRPHYGLTKLSDMSKSEYKEIHLSDEKLTYSPQHYNASWKTFARQHHHLSAGPVYSRRKRAALPMQVDWRTKNVIGPVRNQGLCGACWAFSTIGAMEAMAAINTGKLEALSVQEVIDCAGLGNSGCEGGDICLLLYWLSMTKTPIEKESEYPLRLKDGVCKTKKGGTGVTLTSFTCDDFVNNEEKILEAIANHGPVAVAVNALTWQNYLGGVIQYHCSGAPADLNHAVELVGYDLTAPVPYYIAKNSWGSDFGNAGYIHLAVGSNTCGLANEVATVDVK